LNVMKIATIVGARPQFIKAAPVSRALRSARDTGLDVTELIIHTGQHYDRNMSAIFFDELGLAPPRYNLGIGSGTHGNQTGQMLAAIEAVLLHVRPDCVLVYGDTNSTLAGALAAAKLHIPVAHVEAGLRSFNRRMPEEVNRIVADQLSQLLFAPTELAVQNLKREGSLGCVYLVGDVMQDALAEHIVLAESKTNILNQLNLGRRNYLLVTVHRAENTDFPERLVCIVDALRILAAERTLVWPVHPRTRKKLAQMRLNITNLRLIPPLPYLDMLVLERNARMILTDSGGVQKEARWLEVPCITLRDETEWVETLDGGWNRLVGADLNSIVEAVALVESTFPLVSRSDIQAAGAATRVAAILIRACGQPETLRQRSSGERACGPHSSPTSPAVQS
jgi:UDP-N-acetylglucosamine 2-epimerase